MNRGFFFVIEGIDGAGKSTVCTMVAEKLCAAGRDLCVMREPTSGQYGRRVRQLIAAAQEPDRGTLLDLFLRDREEDAALNIGPALAAGKLILMDRYYYSNAAYQGENAGMAGQILKTNLDMGFPLPDRVFFLDLDPAEALRRLAGRSGTAIDCFEREDRLTAIRGNYLAILDERCTIVDASAPAETVAGIIAEEILLRAR